MSATDNEDWLYTISSKKKLIDLNFKEIWDYRDLLVLFVKRDITTVYKQTILGPLWYLIQPLFTALTFTLIFNSVANISTGSVPPFLFNLVGITVWNYFRNCFNSISDTFNINASMFSKVYFPRLIVPISVVISNLMKFGIQLLILIAFYIYYYSQGADIHVEEKIVLFPILIVLLGVLALGLGIIVSSFVTKYRDLKYLMGFGLQLLMYVSAVMYPLQLMQEKLPKFAWLVKYNPVAYIVEASRFMILGEGLFSVKGLLLTTVLSILILLGGIVVFNKTEKSFIDTV